MNDKNLSGTNPEQNDAEETTKGFPIVTRQDEANADFFEMRKKSRDGSWVAAAPVSVTNGASFVQPSAVPESAENTSAEKETASEEPKKEVWADEAQTAESGAAAEPQAAKPEDSDAPQTKTQEAAWADVSAEETTDPAENDELQEEPKPGFWASRKRRIAAGVLGAAAVVVIGFSTFVYTYSGIFPGVRVADEFKLGGMTQEEAQAYIAAEVQDGVFDRRLEITGKDLGTDTDREYSIHLSEVADVVDSQTAAYQAYMIGREGGYFQRVGTVLNSMFTGWDVSLNASMKEGAVAQKTEAMYTDLTYEPIQPSWKVDEEASSLIIDTGTEGLDFDKDKVIQEVSAKLEAVQLDPYVIETYAVDQEKPDAAAIAADVNCEPKNATVDKTDGTTIIEATNGIQVEETAIASAVGDASEQTYTVPVVVTKATIDKAALEPLLFRDTLASATTYYNSGLTSRTRNVTLAAQYCDGVILNPGEEFSYNDTVGERTYARGFRSATIFQEGEEVEGLGGGICQTSSTIYMAVLRADLDVSERHYHMFQVSYTPVSQDATVAWGSKDFRFVNDTDYPIKLDISYGGGALTVRIIGTKTDDKTVSLYAKTSVSGGYKYASLYKTVTVNGVSETNRENRSAYKLQ